jgi:hypothetical protein
MGKEAKYVVRLTMEERRTLESLVAEGRAAADKLLRARMLLKAPNLSRRESSRSGRPGPAGARL